MRDSERRYVRLDSDGQGNVAPKFFLSSYGMKQAISY